MSNYPHVFTIEGRKFRVLRWANTDDAFRCWHEFTSHWAEASDAGFPEPELSLKKEDFTVSVEAELRRIETDRDTPLPEEQRAAMLEQMLERAHDTYVYNERLLAKLETRIWRLPYDYMKRLKADLFRSMEVEVEAFDGGMHWLPLADSEQMAFGDLDPAAITEAVVRGFFTHYQTSFSGNRPLFYSLLEAARARPEPGIAA